MSTPVASPNPLYDSSRPVDIGGRRYTHAGAFNASKTKSFDEEKSHISKEPYVLSPDNKTRYASTHLGVDVTDFLKPKTHLRQKSETDFLDKEQRKSDTDNSENERISTSYVPEDCRRSLEELTEVVLNDTSDAEKHSEEQRTDSSRNSDSGEKTNKRIKRQYSLTTITSPSVTKTSPASRRRAVLRRQSSDSFDSHAELLSPIKTTPGFTTSSPLADIIHALTNEE